MLLNQRADGIDITIRVKPRASKSRVLGERSGAIEVAVAAPPVDGQANTELVRTLADFFDIAPSRIEIGTGKTGKNKIVRLRAIAMADVEQRLRALR